MAIVVRVIYSILLIFLALYISNLLPKKETRSAQESRDNNEHMAFLDIGCECGVMKYAFFLHYEKLRSTRIFGLALYVTLCACSKSELGGGNVRKPQKYTYSQQSGYIILRQATKKMENGQHFVDYCLDAYDCTKVVRFMNMI